MMSLPRALEMLTLMRFPGEAPGVLPASSIPGARGAAVEQRGQDGHASFLYNDHVEALALQ